MMTWTRAVLSVDRALHGVALPDPARTDCGEVPDPVLLLRAIRAAMPGEATVELVNPHDERLRAWLAACPNVSSSHDDHYSLPVGDDAFVGLVTVVRPCAWGDVCSHVFVTHRGETLLEAYGRNRGEHIVWLSSALPKTLVQKFTAALDASSRSAQSTQAHDTRLDRERFAPWACGAD